MVKSMTGYGRKKAENDQREVTVEIKSVNHRYLDLNIKVPRIYSFLEEAVKSAVSSRVSRGKVDVFVSVFTKDGKDVKVTPNLELIREYVEALRQVRDTFGLADDISTMGVAQMPDALSIDKEEPDNEAVQQQVLEVVGQALEEYDAMRRAEGARLCQDIVQRAGRIGQLVDHVEERSPQTVEEYRKRISARMQELLGDTEIAEQRILAEAALFADKVSVTEEIVRLRSHLAQLNTMLSADTAVGRKLDFLVQEMNREANTIGSKSVNAKIAYLVVDIKALIEKIREQVQNVE